MFISPNRCSDAAELGIMTLRVALLACALALAEASELGNSRQRLLSRDKRKRRLPPMAFQLGETVYEADQQKLKECERDRNDMPTPLMMFYGRGDDYCAQMEPLLQQLEKEEGLTVRKFEVWHNTRNTELLRKLDPARCGLPPSRSAIERRGEKRAALSADPAVRRSFALGDLLLRGRCLEGAGFV